MASVDVDKISKFVALLEKQKPVLNLIFEFLNRGKKTPPVAPSPMTPTKPETPAPDDDKIKPPSTRVNVKVASVRAKVIKVQLSRQRFPDAYDPSKGGNQFGTMENLGEINSGAAAIPYDSKFWLDLTPSDENNLQIRSDVALKELKLAFKTAHHAEDSSGGHTWIEGVGGEPGFDGNNGVPITPYKGGDSGWVGQGVSAWLYTSGFVQQFQAFGEGSVKLYGFVDGVKSNEITIRVS